MSDAYDRDREALASGEFRGFEDEPEELNEEPTVPQPSARRHINYFAMTDLEFARYMGWLKQ